MHAHFKCIQVPDLCSSPICGKTLAWIALDAAGYTHEQYLVLPL